MFWLLVILGGAVLGKVLHTNRLSRKRLDQLKAIQTMIKNRMLQGPADLKSFPAAPEAFVVLSPMVKNPNLEITTYGELENVDLDRKPVVNKFSSPMKKF